MRTRNTRLASLLLVLVLLAWGGRAADRLNVLWIGVDDLRCNLGCYGDKVTVTPHIDRLAKAGTIFTRAYVQQAVCAASRASFLTGTRPDTTTVNYPYNDYFTEEFLPAHPSLPAYFAKQGYTTRAGGKLHHGPPLDLAGLSFEKAWHRSGGWRGYADPANRAKDDAGGEDKTIKPPAYECIEVEDDAYQDGRLAEAMVDAIRNAGREEPFFFAPGFVKPHLPFTAPKKYWDLYQRESFVLPTKNRFLGDLVPRDLAAVSYEMPSYEGGQVDFHDDERLRLLTHGYYACTSFTDAQIGKILDALDEAGLRERTVIMLWSDHGFHLGENECFGKHTVFEMATRAPLIVVAPGKPGGQVCEALVEYVDLFPTICELTGVPLPSYLEGTSLVPLLEDPRTPGREAVFSQFPRGRNTEGYSVRTADYRYTEWRRRDAGGHPLELVARELYDHRNDPYESVNVIEQQPDMARQLAAELASMWPPGG